MRRREFIAFVGGASTWPLAEFVALLGGVAACPLVAQAQKPTKRPLIAVLTRWDEPTGVKVFREILRERSDGQNIRVEARSAGSVNGDWTHFTALASELIQLKPDVIVTAGGAVALQELTATIPIVELYLSDPVELGLIESLAHPNSNVTGIIFRWEGLPGKHLEFLRLA